MPEGAKWVVELAVLPIAALTICQVRFRGQWGLVAGTARRKQQGSRIRSAGVIVPAE